MIKESQLILIGLSSIILALLMAIFILIFGRSLPPSLPLFYSLPWGENQLATHQQILSLPTIAIGISLINLMFFLRLSPIQTVLRNILAFSSIVTSLILAISLIKIVFLFI